MLSIKSYFQTFNVIGYIVNPIFNWFKFTLSQRIFYVIAQSLEGKPENFNINIFHKTFKYEGSKHKIEFLCIEYI